jgi:hypothetical protein
MNRYFFLLVSLFYLTTISASQAKQDFAPTILVVDKNNASYDEIILDLLSLQKSLIVCPSQIPEPFMKTGFLLVSMTSEYVASLLEKKGGQMICMYLDQTLLGYIILTEAAEFEELYQDISAGRFETTLSLSSIHDWLSDPAVGYIEQIGIRPGYSRIGKTIKPHGLISDVFIDPVKNNASLCFFSSQNFTSPGILYQYPGAHPNFPCEHKTRVFFWYGSD